MNYTLIISQGIVIKSHEVCHVMPNALESGAIREVWRFFCFVFF